ncbi:MAG TPA: formimidoylglutamate deiminase [Pyrinomonadaceae bacterium]
MEQAWLPDLIFVDGRFQSEVAIVCDSSGRISRIGPAHEITEAKRLKGRALLPGLINAHSHAFQRVIRGRTEYRSQHSNDSFWTWRELMYAAANRLEVEDIYDASRMAFMEMALAGITAVGEFHYLHKAPGGTLYTDPNLLAKEVIRAANDVGLRIAMLRVAYERAGFQKGPNPLQQRFIETSDDYLTNLQSLVSQVNGKSELAWTGAAPHSVRAVSLDYLKTVASFTSQHELPLHMHVAEQPGEVEACIEEYGRSPVALLDTEGILNERFTAVHAIHVTPQEIAALAQHRANVCACPTTERNLGDGVIPTDGYLAAGVPISLGSDSQIQIDLLEDARELEYELRLQRQERNVLAPEVADGPAGLAYRLFECATINGARSLGVDAGRLEAGSTPDFFTVDLNDPSIAGASTNDLLASILFSLSRTAIREVVVGGKTIISEGRHPDQGRITERFNALQAKLWN